MINIQDTRLSIVVSEFNPIITNSLLESAIECFINSGGSKNNIDIFKVSGAFEIPGVVSQILKKNKAHIIVAL